MRGRANADDRLAGLDVLDNVPHLLVRQIAEARVKTDKEDVKRLIRLLIADIVPEVWGAAGGSARVARDDLVSQSIGQDQHDDSESTAKSAASA